MVVGELTDAAVDELFRAPADPTRRDRFAAVRKHVAVLERTGLVTKERRGRPRAAGARRARDDLARAGGPDV